MLFLSNHFWYRRFMRSTMPGSVQRSGTDAELECTISHSRPLSTGSKTEKTMSATMTRWNVLPGTGNASQENPCEPSTTRGSSCTPLQSTYWVLTNEPSASGPATQGASSVGTVGEHPTNAAAWVQHATERSAANQIVTVRDPIQSETSTRIRSARPKPAVIGTDTQRSTGCVCRADRPRDLTQSLALSNRSLTVLCLFVSFIMALISFRWFSDHALTATCALSRSNGIISATSSTRLHEPLT
mmetsp:Transcript_38814/g.123340  ORF Transcript_38814/g.123340 Transcript_38814/m.123340 type:complete len:243 (-) Transcript_38814:3484-4212(-)